jgi:anthranilate/para-aminobenzoate synthase component II
MAVYANCTDHMFIKEEGTFYVKELAMTLRQFQERGLETYVIPLMAGAAVPSDLRDDWEEESVDFDSLLHQGDSKLPDPQFNAGDPNDIHVEAKPVGSRWAYSPSGRQIERELLVPESDAWRIRALRRFVRNKRGVYIGYCGGHQLCGVAMGATLDRVESQGLEAKSHYNTDHPLWIEHDTLMSALVQAGEIDMNSVHNWVLTDMGPELPIEVTARSTEPGGGVVEVVEHKLGLGIGIQGHTEYLLDAETNPDGPGHKITDGLARYIEVFQLVRERHGKVPEGCLRSVLLSVYLGE